MADLTHEEKVLAWDASWDPSFSGMSILDKQGRFRLVNPQFCKILGVTPAELIGQRFQDITPVDIRKLEETNAMLLIKGEIHSYIIKKSYEFPTGKICHVILLMVGVYNEEGKFQFFLSRILRDTTNTPVVSPSLPPIKRTGFIKQYGSIFAAIGTAIGAMILYIIEHIKK